MSDKTNNGWVEREDGWHKEGAGKGNADYFNREIPPVRDDRGLPLKGDGSGKVDWVKWDKELNGGN